MSAERRLKQRHATVMMSLYQSGQELQGRLQQLQEAIDGQIEEWVSAYGLNPDAQHHVEVRPDGESYLIELPKPAEPPAPAEKPEVDHGNGV